MVLAGARELTGGRDDRECSPPGADARVGIHPLTFDTNARWTQDDVYEFGRLVGMGLSGPEIVDVMDRSLGAVTMKLLRMRKKLTNRRDGSVAVPITVYPQAKHVIDEAAVFHGQRREHVIECLCQIVDEEGELFLENLLDDQG